MPGSYEKAITIRQAIDNIDDRSFLLPAIQRNFVWSTQQICVLFDSLMRGYPINSFMMWDVTSPEIKSNYLFYNFLTDYCQYFKETNDHWPTKGGFKDFKAVIDGQQRLTSIYIGLKGTYAYKQPRVWWPKTRDDKILPPRRLYLDLNRGVEEEGNESLMQYHFRFLTENQVTAANNGPNLQWFEVGKVLDLPEVNSVDEIPLEVVIPELEKHGLSSNRFALKALTRLYHLVRNEELIHYYNETSQDIDHVLDVFIRTNSGGTPLAFSDLLMSIAVANWEGDARKAIDDLVTQVRQGAEMGFSIGRDWVLKSCLMLTDTDVRFRVTNFDSNRVDIIQNQWDGIRECIVETFRLLRNFGLNDQSMRAKNAVIPIAFYLYKQKSGDKPLYQTINNPVYHRDERNVISRWLHMVILKGVFGGQADGTLTKLRKTLSHNLSEGIFPLGEIIETFTATSQDIRFDEEYLNGLIQIQYEDPRCRSVLALLLPEVNENQQLDIDHLHPKSAFTKNALESHNLLNSAPEKIEFFQNKNNWNSIVNLHLLNSSRNRSKGDTSLMEWIGDKNNGIKPVDILLDNDVSLEFEDFMTFYDKRREALLSRLRNNLVMSGAPLTAVESLDEDDDEESRP